MSSIDLQSNIVVVPVLPVQAYLTAEDGAGVIDTNGFESLTLVNHIGTVTNAQALVVETSDVHDEGFDGIAAGNVIGGTAALNAFEEVGAGDGDLIKTLGVIAPFRYVKVSCTGDGVTGAVIGVSAILGHSQQKPADKMILTIEE